MNVHILSVFPEMFRPILGASMLGKASLRGILNIDIVDIRDFTLNKHKKTDDVPFGGGAGMVMTAQPVFSALRAVNAEHKRILYMSPRGRMLDGKLSENLSKEKELVILCGHYEGIDQRILDYWKPEEVSIGDYILTGGELAAMVVIDSFARFIPDVLGNEESVMEESLYSGLLEYPQFTRPREYENMVVPDILISGDHRAISLWKFEQSCIITKEHRPDLWKAFILKFNELDKDKKKIVEKLL